MVYFILFFWNKSFPFFFFWGFACMVLLICLELEKVFFFSFFFVCLNPCSVCIQSFLVFRSLGFIHFPFISGGDDFPRFSLNYFFSNISAFNFLGSLGYFHRLYLLFDWIVGFFFSWRETVFETMSILLFGLLRNFEKREVIKKEKSEPLFLVGFIRREVSIQLSIFGSRFPLSRNKSRKKKNVIIFIFFSYFHFSLQPNRGLLFLFDSCVSVHIRSFRRYGSSSKSDVLYSGWQVFDLILGCSPDISIPFIIWSVCIFLCKVLDSFTERSRLWGLVFIQCEISYLWNGRKKDYCLRFFWFILWVIV